MREILFRGKRTDGKGWMYGYYSFNPITNMHWIRTPRTTYWDEDMIDPSTVGQYTGKTDKDKNRVFDGDIIRMFNAKPPFDVGIVQWDDHDQCYVVRSTWSEKCHLTDFGNLGRPEYFEVIGNINDNPEMLKGGEG